ncbi:nucleotide exchange factor GrpE [Chelatococcus sambhunathii]|uniref:Protein GrpE n=2 Tax=Chelatococcus sambhunathii TaxID=363953 RepID=A0ABU1DH18_9HYPH|nr:nucleotide exchange factor GrpE [Chelatococcus sambhunathii]MDR4307412.1 nucleotide exchange factor GrpE [Chelatococcus sambhunathii]
MPDPMSADNAAKPKFDGDPKFESDAKAASGQAKAGAPETDETRADATVEPEVTEAAPQPVDRTPEFEAALAEMRDRLLRAHAEMENLRRRTEREVQDAKRYANAGFARDLLGVADNLRRAIDAASAGTGGADAEDTDPALAALLEGVELTERELLKALEKNGVTRLEPKGQVFDPHRHEAVFEAPDPSVPSGTVVQVMQDGYMIGDRILRPAMVGVARGGPKPGAPEAAAAAGLDRKA